MKIRDYLILGLMLFAFAWFMQPDPFTAKHPIAAKLIKAAKWAGIYYVLAHDEPPPEEPQQYQEFPDEIRNADPERPIGQDGYAHIRHGEGW